MRIKIARYRTYRKIAYALKRRKEVEEMETERKVMTNIRQRGGMLTPAKIAKSINTDIEIVKRSISNLERGGQIRTMTLERMLLMGK